MCDEALRETGELGPRFSLRVRETELTNAADLPEHQRGRGITFGAGDPPPSPEDADAGYPVGAVTTPAPVAYLTVHRDGDELIGMFEDTRFKNADGFNTRIGNVHLHRQ